MQRAQKDEQAHKIAAAQKIAHIIHKSGCLDAVALINDERFARRRLLMRYHQVNLMANCIHIESLPMQANIHRVGQQTRKDEALIGQDRMKNNHPC